MRRLLIILSLLVLAGCGSKERVTDVFYPMGGIPMQITAYDVSNSRFQEVFSEIKARVEVLEGTLSVYIRDSDLGVLNEKGVADVSEDTLVVIEQALRFCKSTEGAFDPTVASVIELWTHAGKTDKAPGDDELALALERVGCNKVETSHTRSRVRFTQQGMRLDLGGIAKGYIAAEAVNVMKKRGITRGIVDAGGDVVVFSGKGDQPFRVGIKHPMEPKQVFAILSVANGAVVTSGCYERFVEIGGKRICHIIDPRTGKPAGGLLSVTVLARDASAADAYATALFVLGPDDGFSLAKSLPEVEAVFLIEGDNGDKLRMKATPGLTGKLELAN
ncbi:MAG: FAD:protein FMN transferase [Pseudomonadota bacterium]